MHKQKILAFLPTPNTNARSEDLMETVEYPQLYVYDVCLHRFGGRHEWLGFIDADEFLVLTGGDPSLPALLRRCAPVLCHVCQMWCSSGTRC